jgi:hypothetical protein
MKELNYVHRFFGCLTLMVKQAGIVDSDKGSAADTWGDDIVIALEFLFKLLCQWYGLTLKPGIGHRLSAARLILWVFYLKSQML